MNNPQHYQPLGHALHQPSVTSTQTHLSYKPPPSVFQPSDARNNDINSREEEEEDEDDPDDADEGLVEEQLNPTGPVTQSNTTTVPSTGSVQTASQQQLEPSQAPEGKRRPGRPRGSKNRKPRAVTQSTSRLESQSHQPAVAQNPPPPQNNDAQGGQSQQFYEFQWRILNLCAEFYGAAEELVKGTSPLVLAQCYQAGSDASQDPMKMLTEAKRVCDNLLANPSRFALNAATSVCTSLSSGFQGSTAPSAPSVQSGSAGSSATSKASTPMITNPQSFVVPLGAQPAYPHAQYPMFNAAPAQYPPHYYHQYSYPPPTAAYYQQPILTTNQLQTQASPLPSATTTTVASSPISSSGMLNQGAWSEEETEKLKKLSEESRAYSSVGEIEWDWVVSQYGSSRTRHQILIKATSLGLKESSSRGTKRRREADDEVGPSGPAPPPPPPSNPPSSSATAATAASPALSHATSTPLDSPALQSQPWPPTSKGSTLSTTSNLPWPMPTVAVNTPSPVISASTVSQDQQRTSYYRPRPSQDTTKSRTQHNYMYQSTNGNSATGPRLNQENGSE
ncbi:hypothetical protein M378DRAFT_294543 [Amanita muscaria Koide BX008]|uniref:Myb-like domain-containing protein n=1 Tax=Amanita muscaria (strain Koide BX008) TaxID=946122 RepID=A0A0C2WR31_AMAMK|nr:hypothetical protein M378DRAFT_294543 [Amanita muscaria Koide BX008]